MVTSQSLSQQYRTVVSHGGLELFADVSREKGGEGNGFRPHDLLCAALASCLNINLRMILAQRELEYDGVRVEVDLDRSEESKSIFCCELTIDGGLAQDIKDEIIAQALHCPVYKTLSKAVEVRRS